MFDDFFAMECDMADKWARKNGYLHYKAYEDAMEEEEEEEENEEDE